MSTLSSRHPDNERAGPGEPVGTVSGSALSASGQILAEELWARATQLGNPLVIVRFRTEPDIFQSSESQRQLAFGAPQRHARGAIRAWQHPGSAL